MGFTDKSANACEFTDNSANTCEFTAAMTKAKGSACDAKKGGRCTAGSAATMSAAAGNATCTAPPATKTTAKPDNHDDHDHSPSPGTVDSASTMSPASIVTMATMLIAYMMC